jgi:hypothetical protein
MSAKHEDIPSHRRSGAASREERLEAELRANLKRRKEQARARARAGVGGPGGAEKAANSAPSGEDDGC